MEFWPKRAVEEANLFNPAFYATLLAKAADEFAKKAGMPLPFALAFLVLPVVLHQGTREALPGSTITALLPWIQDNREQLVDFAVRVQRLREITREAILFAAQHESLALTQQGDIVVGPKRKSVTERRHSRLLHAPERMQRRGRRDPQLRRLVRAAVSDG